MAGLHIYFRIRVPRSWVRWGTAGSLLLSLAPELATESVTLTTYYPAPKGVYAKLMTTGNSYLARDSGTVGIPTTTPNPTAKLHIVGSTILQNNGAFLEGSFFGSQRLTVQNDAGTKLNFYGDDGAGLYPFMTIDNSGSDVINFPVRVGIGNTAPLGSLDVGGEGIIIVRQQCGSPSVAYLAGGAGSPCGAGTYPTVISGLMTRFRPDIYGSATNLAVSSPGQLMCCPCPAGGCPDLP